MATLKSIELIITVALPILHGKRTSQASFCFWRFEKVQKHLYGRNKDWKGLFQRTPTWSSPELSSILRISSSGGASHFFTWTLRCSFGIPLVLIFGHRQKNSPLALDDRTHLKCHPYPPFFVRVPGLHCNLWLCYIHTWFFFLVSYFCCKS